jgi:hypothetical protein
MIVRRAAWLILDLARAFTLALLAAVEPVARLALTSTSVLASTMAAFFAITNTPPQAPVLPMLLVSAAALALLRAYYQLMRCLQ